jgi:hypothetical protein
MKTYKGKESHNLIKVDTANILVYDYFIDYYQNISNDELRTMIENLLLAINSSDSISKVTFNDPRYVYVAIQTLSKHDGYKEVDMVDWILFYGYLKLYYDKRMNGYDDLIRWTNLFIGYSFAKTELTLEESQELSELSKKMIDIIESDEDYQAFVPNYIIGGMMQGVDFSEGDIIDVIDIQDTQEILDLPTQEEKDKVMGEINSEQIQEVLGEETPITPQEPQLSDEAREKVSSYEVLIRNLKDLINQGGWSDDEKLELEDAVDAYEEAISDIKSGTSFEFGGILQSFSSPQIVDGMYSVISMFNNGGTTHEELIKTFEFADGSKFIVEFYKSGENYRSPNLLKIEGSPKNPKEKSLAMKTFEQINRDKMDFQDAIVRLVKAKVIKKIEGGDGRFKRYRILKDSSPSSSSYSVWNSIHGDLMQDFSSEEDAKNYISGLEYRVGKDERDNNALMSDIEQLQNQLNDVNDQLSRIYQDNDNVDDRFSLIVNRLVQDKSEINRKLAMKKAIFENRTGVRFSQGGQSKFNKLSNKVAKNYEGKKVPSEYQKEYGKTYSKQEAKEVGNKVASKVYRLQLAEKNKAKWGGKYAEGGKAKEEEYLTYAESQKKYHERAGTTSIKDKRKMAIDFVKENPQVLLLENGAKLNGVPNVEELAKRKLSGNFELPFEMAIYVPSTKNIDEIIGKDEFTSRIKEVETFVSKVFGGFSTDRVDGGFYSDDRKKLVREDVAKVYVFGSEYDFESNFNQLINKLKQWGKAWSQESMGFEFEGDLYYVSSAKSKSKDTKMAHGGRVSIEALKEMVGEKPKKLTNREKITMAKAKYSN